MPIIVLQLAGNLKAVFCNRALISEVSDGCNSTMGNIIRNVWQTTNGIYGSDRRDLLVDYCFSRVNVE